MHACIVPVQGLAISTREQIQIPKTLLQGLSAAKRHKESSAHYPGGPGEGAVPDTAGE